VAADRDGLATAAALAAMIEAAGITVATGEGDLVVVAASPDAPVLPAALAAG